MANTRRAATGDAALVPDTASAYVFAPTTSRLWIQVDPAAAAPLRIRIDAGAVSVNAWDAVLQPGQVLVEQARDGTGFASISVMSSAPLAYGKDFVVKGH